MGGCQKYDPFWGTLNNTCRIIIGIQRGTIILTTTHINYQGTCNPILVTQLMAQEHGNFDTRSWTQDDTGKIKGSFFRIQGCRMFPSILSSVTIPRVSTLGQLGFGMTPKQAELAHPKP